MKAKICYMIVFIVILIFGFSLIAEAAETGKKFVGFEFGINYLLPNESSLEGSGRYFSLLFPINKEISVGVFHETDKYSGERTVGVVKVTRDLDVTINEIRLSKNIDFKNKNFMVVPFLGIGSASISKDLDETAIVGDIGTKITPLKTPGELTETKLSIDLLYRFMPINSTNLYGDSKSINDLGGFVISANFAVLF